ncbi:ankyrin repeat domain-containing protein [Pararhizobium sp.]|uniref:ankyrin repeat domain-containing protein n=1 Tax=Pararhizobium sp. TaxID=1977563 RepID=UPI00272417F3|nr:ankyrin repeat domain-containing protein [Pararhizobium sp.]MDO9418937.1 ankyrin repeat domain-containing protein [Pararhizobium sp.]
MTTRILAANTSLDSLKKQAKAFLKALEAGDAAVRQRAKPYFSDPSKMGLQDVQLVIAREFGFSSWTKLKAHLDDGEQTSESADQRANRFLSLSAVSYFSTIAADPARFEAALTLLTEHPELVRGNLHAAAAAGDSAEIARILKVSPHLVDRKGGPYDWAPLLYATYARLPGRSTLAAVGTLLAHGADADAHYMDDGSYRFTALTGAFGEGEAGNVRQPQHPDCMAVARLLLDAGANANDSQALYNRMFEPDDTCLALLLDYGLSADDRNNWLVREDGKLVASSERVLEYQLAWALQHKMPSRVRLLVEHGVDITRPVNGRLPYEWALLGGDLALADYLVSRGATPVEMRDVDQLARACNGSLRVEAEALAAASPSLVGRTQDAHPALLHEAAGSNAIGPVTLMLDLGFNVNKMTSRTPLHEAALHGHMEMAALLIARGADTTLRDPYHHAPPLGWAEYNGHREMVDFLMTQPLDIFSLAAFGKVDAVAEKLASHPGLLDRPFGQFRKRGKPDPARDWLPPLGFAILQNQADMVRFLIEAGANTTIRDGAGRSLKDLAREHGGEALAELLRPVSSD